MRHCQGSTACEGPANTLGPPEPSQTWQGLISWRSPSRFCPTCHGESCRRFVESRTVTEMQSNDPNVGEDRLTDPIWAYSHCMRSFP